MPQQTITVNWTLVLEYLKVFLSWPVVIGIGGTICLTFFKNDVRALIKRIATVEFPGGKIVTQQEKLNEETPVSVEEATPVTTVANDPPVPAIDQLTLTAAERDALRAAFLAERIATRLWEYRFVNYFFAPMTQAVLDWLIGLGQATTVGAYDAYCTPRIQNGGERQAILTALQMHTFIQIDANVILTVTDKGREYAAWPERRILNAPATPAA